MYKLEAVYIKFSLKPVVSGKCLWRSFCAISSALFLVSWQSFFYPKGAVKRQIFKRFFKGKYYQILECDVIRDSKPWTHDEPFSLSLESALGPFGTHNTSLLLHNKHRMIPNPVNIPWKENSWSNESKACAHVSGQLPIGCVFRLF